MIIEKIQNSLEHLEANTLNCMRIPILSTFSGMVRAVIGAVQVVFGAIGALYSWSEGNEKTLYYSKHHFVHGVLNLGRAVIEMIPIVNLIMLAYDYDANWSHLDSAHRFKYVEYQPVPQRAR